MENHVEVWAQEGKKFQGKMDECKFELGDWLCVGEKQFKKNAFKHAEFTTGYAKASLRELARVSAATPVVVRTTFSELNWEHFRAVSYKLIPVGEKEGWLRKASAETLSAAQLKAAIRGNEESTPSRKVISFSTSDEGFETFRLLRDFRIREVADMPGAPKQETNRICISALQDYFAQPNVAEEIRLAAEREEVLQAVTAMKKETKAKIAAWLTVERLLSGIVTSKGKAPDPRDFAKEYEMHSGKAFTRRVFQSACKKSKTFAVHYPSDMGEDFGLPQPNRKIKKVRSRQLKTRQLTLKEKLDFVDSVNAVVARCKTSEEFAAAWIESTKFGMIESQFELALKNSRLSFLSGKSPKDLTASDFGFDIDFQSALQIASEPATVQA
jgi:hypothetical protein